MRKEFAKYLYLEMLNNTDIWLVTADLGFILWDDIRRDFPDRFINTGASEQAASDICVGLALSGKISFFYSITPFALYRCFETLRTYINHENISVKLIGSGRDKEYVHDGFSHDASDVKPFLDLLPNINQFWPETKEEIPHVVDTMLQNNKPCFLSLRR